MPLQYISPLKSLRLMAAARLNVPALTHLTHQGFLSLSFFPEKLEAVAFDPTNTTE